MKMRSLMTCCFLLSSLVIFAQTDQPKNPILERLDQMEDTFKAKEYKKLADFYSDSATMLGSRVELSGRDTIRSYWSNLKDRGLDWKLESTSLQKIGTAYLQRGISRMSFMHNTKPMQANSKFTLVWILENDEWVILLDHFSPLN